MDRNEKEQLLALIDRVSSERDFRGQTSEADREAAFPWDIWQTLVDIGIPSLEVPASEGGAGASTGFISEVLELLARYSIAASTSLFTFAGFAAHLLDALPADHPLRAHLAEIGTGEFRGALGLTEASGGSDLSNMKSRLESTGGGWTLSGSKLFTTLASEASHLIVGALVPADEDRRWTERFAFCVVPSNHPSVSLTRIGTQALRPCPTYEVHFERVEVSPDAVVEPPVAMSSLVAVLNRERLAVAAQSCGFAVRALELGLTHAQQRSAFGSPLIAKQAVAHSLADCWQSVTDARIFVHHVSSAPESDAKGILTTMAQRRAAEVAHLTADAALQIHGGSGFATDSEIQRIWRDTRLHLIGPVAREVSADFLSRSLTTDGLSIPIGDDT